ncbi:MULTISPECIES: DUF3142 domain-containing protein [unclassified Herbaspirillum]|uniref:DUF3142 domain-containing protein n=1 Tax=unclassified Herbaspirillum TaxID=2624150 RepID=UPI001F28332D|nr:MULTISPECIES: DUF3142 domain-containing protein [unclassified Herbaspirillum]
MLRCPPFGLQSRHRRLRSISVLLLLSICGLLAACQRAPQVLPQQAYIWQRQWSPAVAAAMQASDQLVGGWRVLAGELSAQRQWKIANPDWQALKTTQHAIAMVVRLDGQTESLDAATHARISDLLARWRQQGVPVAGVEIDYDCPTSQLPAYRDFLAGLRQSLDRDTTLSITALPTWLNSPELSKLLAVADESVLQVHAVMNPRQGLFDAERAQAWLKAYAKQTTHPWRVALPSYSTRVSWDDNGRISTVESERPLLASGSAAQELTASPAVVSAFLAQLDKNPEPGLVGVVWFRLPTEDDVRNWSLPTWQAVLARQPLKAAVTVEAQVNTQNTQAGLHDLTLRNNGNADSALPLIVRIDAASACDAADGINGYALEADAQGKYLRRTHDGLLRAGYQRNIGWAHCGQQHIQLHVEH